MPRFSSGSVDIKFGVSCGCAFSPWHVLFALHLGRRLLSPFRSIPGLPLDTLSPTPPLLRPSRLHRGFRGDLSGQLEDRPSPASLRPHPRLSSSYLPSANPKNGGPFPGPSPQTSLHLWGRGGTYIWERDWDLGLGSGVLSRMGPGLWRKGFSCPDYPSSSWLQGERQAWQPFRSEAVWGNPTSRLPKLLKGRGELLRSPSTPHCGVLSPLCWISPRPPLQ